MTVKPNKMMLTRILAVMLVLIIALSVVSTGSLVNIMIIKGEKYQKDASEQQLYDSLVTAPRGDIYDRNMQKLATSSPAWTVYITPNGIKSLKKESDAEAVRKKIAEGLSEILEMDYNTVYDYTGKKSYYVIVKKKVEKTVADKVRQFILDNKDLELSQYIGLDSTTKRYYPNGTPSSFTSAGDSQYYVMTNSQNSVSKTTVPASLSSNVEGVYADLTSATAYTINSLRQAFQIQRLYERDARGGTRYTEILRAHFGVVSPDARLQRPEYLGGSSSPININPVQQTSATDSTSPQGNLAAFGLTSSKIHGFTKSFVEHGYIIGLVNVRADLTYQQGLQRLWSRQTRFDFYWPALAHLGEQAVLNKAEREPLLQ